MSKDRIAEKARRAHKTGSGLDRPQRSPVMQHLRLRMKLGWVSLAIVIGVGIVGYRLLEGWSLLECFYMTVITISTVGFKEVGDLSDAGRVFTVVLIFSGIGTIAVAGSSFLEWMIEKNVGKPGRNKRMSKAIQSLKQHVIICGYGRMGRYVVNELNPLEADFVIIDQNPEICRDIEEKGLLVVQGDATDEDVLEEAGIRRARALVASLNSDADNLYLTLTVHGMNPGVRIIVRAEEHVSHAKFMRAGATKVVSPYEIGADHIVQLLMRPRLVDFIELVTQRGALELNIDQSELAADSPLCHKSLVDSHARQILGRMILAVKKQDGTSIFDPSPDTVLEPGDVLVTIGIENA